MLTTFSSAFGSRARPSGSVSVTTSRELPTTFGMRRHAPSLEVSISGDGRLLAVRDRRLDGRSGDTNGQFDVFVRDRIAGTTRRVSLTSAGGQAEGGESRSGEISSDGRFLVFASTAENLAPRLYDYYSNSLFIRDLVTGTTEPSKRRTRPSPSNRRTRRLRAGKVVLHPAKPRAGRRLTASVAITQGGKPVVSATIACSAKINGRRALRVITRGYRNGQAGCSWMLPAS